jgi:Uma2 family endonuclease
MAIVYKFSDLDLTKTYSYADYLLWQFQERVELIKGFIMKMSPVSSLRHQRLANNLTGCFYENLKRKPCSSFPAPFDVRLPVPNDKKDTTIVQPDLCVICDDAKLFKGGCDGAPDLCVEIISPGNSKHDIHTKFNLYQEAGVLEYWMVEPEERMILIYTLVNGKYIGLRPFVEGDFAESPLFPDLKIALDDVFYRV